MANWQRDRTTIPHLDGNCYQWFDIHRADVIRRLRVSDQRTVRLWVPLELFGRDQPLPERRRERDKRGGWPRRVDDCEHIDIPFGIGEEVTVRISSHVRRWTVNLCRSIFAERNCLPGRRSSLPWLCSPQFSLLRYSSRNLFGLLPTRTSGRHSHIPDPNVALFFWCNFNSQRGLEDWT